MLFKSVVAPVLALSAVAFADSSSSSNVCSSSVTATSQSDLDKIAGCTVFKGDIILSSGLVTAAINGVQSVQGSVIAKNVTTLTSIAAPKLANISQALTLDILESLTTADFPSLTSVSELNLITLNKLSNIGFASVVSSVDKLIVSDTTLGSIAGIAPTKLSVLNINNNINMTSIDFALRSVNELDISSTANSFVLNFPYLTSAHNVTFRDAKSVDIHNLTTINSTISFVNTSVTNIQLNKVKAIGGSLAIVSNSKLTNISFPILETIGGGFQIANNTKLSSLSGFPVLNSVGGAVQFVGNFDNATLPDLQTVRGGVNINSDSESFNCSSWNALQQDNGIRGDSYQCKAKSSSTSVAITATGTRSGSHSGSASATASVTGSASSKNGAAAVYAIESTSLLGALAVFVLQFV